MLASVQDCLEYLRCPRCQQPLQQDENGLEAVDPQNGQTYRYRILDGKPILIDETRSVISAGSIESRVSEGVVERHSYSGVSQWIKSRLSPEKSGTRGNVTWFIDDLTTASHKATSGRARVLVIGGGSIGQGMKPLYDSDQIEVVGFDLYLSDYTQFVADGHHLPLTDDLFDGVVIQAVLEHVLQPQIVVDEIWRVLKPGGVVYAETPFMQQVHEGAYDFTRFTESGHRYLFRHFDHAASGSNGGPGIAFMWSVDYLVRGLFRSRMAGKMAKLAFFWVQYLDRLIPESYAVDGASGVYFLGRKSTQKMTPQDAVDHYQGAQ